MAILQIELWDIFKLDKKCGIKKNCNLGQVLKKINARTYGIDEISVRKFDAHTENIGEI